MLRSQLPENWCCLYVCGPKSGGSVIGASNCYNKYSDCNVDDTIIVLALL